MYSHYIPMKSGLGLSRRLSHTKGPEPPADGQPNMLGDGNWVLAAYIEFQNRLDNQMGAPFGDTST